MAMRKVVALEKVKKLRVAAAAALKKLGTRPPTLAIGHRC